MRLSFAPSVLPGYELLRINEEYTNDSLNFDPKIIPKTRPIIRQSMSKCSQIFFSMFDEVLQRQFYKISFSTIRRKLWLGSTKTSKLGKKPITYLVRSFHYEGAGEVDCTLIENCDNIVFYVQGFVQLKDSVNLAKIQQFIEFDNNLVHLENFAQLPKQLELIMTPSVIDANFCDCKIEMELIMSLLPNLKYLTLEGNLPNDWEESLFNYENPMKRISIISTTKIVNWKLFREFVKRQRPNFYGWIYNLEEWDEEEMRKYFIVVNEEKEENPYPPEVPYLEHNFSNFKLYCN